jgi:hypothetical protein
VVDDMMRAEFDGEGGGFRAGRRRDHLEPSLGARELRRHRPGAAGRVEAEDAELAVLRTAEAADLGVYGVDGSRVNSDQQVVRAGRGNRHPRVDQARRIVCREVLPESHCAHRVGHGQPPVSSRSALRLAAHHLSNEVAEQCAQARPESRVGE